MAIARNFAIGKDNQLLFHLSGDLKRFKQITTGHPVIMGRNTLLSLPKGALPNRRNIIITDIPYEKFDRCEIVYSIAEAVEAVKNEEEAFIIGGGMIYRQFYPIAGRLYLTVVHRDFDADVYFPEIDYSEWEEFYHENLFDEKNCFEYSYLNLIRKPL